MIPVELPTSKASVLTAFVDESPVSPSRFVLSDVREGHVGRIVDAHHLDRSVLEDKASNRRRCHFVGVEELGLRLSSVRSLSVPPQITITIDVCTRYCSYGDIRSRHGDQRTRPFFVAKGCFALKDDLVRLA